MGTNSYFPIFLTIPITWRPAFEQSNNDTKLQLQLNEKIICNVVFAW